LSNPLLDQIRAKLATVAQGQVILKTSIDPGLLGGLVVRIGDKVYDSSLATQLHKMRDVALEKTGQQIRQAADRFVNSA
jgi:F-type H+-transporting ATPase subunit delta